MDIGPPKRVIEVEPVTLPVPELVPEPVGEPVTAPAEAEPLEPAVPSEPAP